LYDSFIPWGGADCPCTKRRSAIREGRYRTPDRQQQIRMREVHNARIESIPVNVPRSEIEAMGDEIGLDDPTEAARIFDRLKGMSWRGDYETSEVGWVAAWVLEVIC
jgi:uncharacterized Zn finger protein